jgi:hypothetical protein
MQYHTHITSTRAGLRIEVSRNRNIIPMPSMIKPHKDEIVVAARRAANYSQRAVFLVDPATKAAIVRLYGHSDVRHAQSVQCERYIVGNGEL